MLHLWFKGSVNNHVINVCKGISLSTVPVILKKNLILATWKYFNLNTPGVVGMVQEQKGKVAKD